MKEPFAILLVTNDDGTVFGGQVVRHLQEIRGRVGNLLVWLRPPTDEEKQIGESRMKTFPTGEIIEAFKG